MRATRAGTGSAMPSTCSRAALPTLTATDVFGRDRGLELDARQVDDLDQLGIDGDALARLHQALRDEAARSARRSTRVGARLARQLDRGLRRLSVARAPARCRDRGLERGRRDEALRRPAPGCSRARARRCRAGLRATPPVCSAWRSFQSNSVVSRWPSTWPALTRSPSRTVSSLHLGRDARLDQRAVDRLQPARDRRACAAARRRARVDDVARREIEPPARLARRVAATRLLGLARLQRARDAARRAASTASSGSSHFSGSGSSVATPALRAGAAWRGGRAHAGPSAGRARGRAAPGRAGLRSSRFGSSCGVRPAQAPSECLFIDQEDQRRHQRMDDVVDIDRRGIRRASMPRWTMLGEHARRPAR